MKNTKIMAVLVVLLAAMLFVGSAAALTDTDMGNLSVTDVSGSTLALKIENSTLSFNVTNATTDGARPPALTAVWYGWTTPESPEAKFTQIQATDVTGNEAKIELNGTMFGKVGTYKLILSDNAGTSSGNWTTTSVTFNVVNATLVTPEDTPNTAQNVFVNQLIFVDDPSGTPPTSLVLYDGEAGKSTALNTISGKGGIFNLLDSAVKGQYGSYYTGAGYVNIWDPSMTLKVELAGSPGDSVNGKTVTRDTELAFYVEAPVVANADAVDAKVKLVFTPPSGGSVTTFGITEEDSAGNFLDIPLKDASQLINTVAPGSNAQAGVWTVQAEYTSPEGFKNYAAKSNTITFTVQSSTLTLTAAEDSVIRSNPFMVTIKGNANTPYAIYIDNADATDNAPTLAPGQVGEKGDFTKIAKYGGDTTTDVANGAVFTTKADGTRDVLYNTGSNTNDKSYTIKVNALNSSAYTDEQRKDEDYVAGTTVYIDQSNYATEKVKVEIGTVTMSASGDGSYYIGDEIVLSGTNTDSDYVYLFITGKNIDAYVLKDLPTKTPASEATNPVEVKTDNTWEYKWDTSRIALDPGTYAVYATSKLTNGKSNTKTVNQYSETAVALSDSEYASVSVKLMKPFLSAVPSGTVVAKGDKLVITGTAEGDPSTLKLYIFGTNYFLPETITVEDDGTYKKEVPIDSDRASGQYFVVVQHPMMDGDFDAKLGGSEGNRYFYIPNVGNPTGAQSSFFVEGEKKLTGSQAADSLTKMIDSANIDDVYTKLTFTVSDPWIAIDGPGDQAVGTTFTISGTTNLAVDDQISVEVTSSSFTAADKTQNTGTSGVTIMTKVVAGDGVNNVWSVEVDTTNWELDEYNVNVDGLEIDVTATATFNLVEQTVTPTATATGATPTTTATATATTAPTQTPGFGAFVALAGLGAVALLVLRRN